MNDHISAAPTGWVYEKPVRNGKMQLLTIGGISVTGVWKGELGEFYMAWAPLLRRNKEREAEIRKLAGERNNKLRRTYEDFGKFHADRILKEIENG